MKKSIYEIQNPVDFLPYTHDYLIQALANMGQRIGLQGNGIKYNTFKFSDIICSDEYNAENEIGFIKYDKVISGESNILGAYFGIVDKGTLYNGTNNKIPSTNKYYMTTTIENIVRMKYQLQFDIPINNIEKYSPNSIIHNDGNTLTTILIGKYFGYDDEDQNNAEIIYNKFNIYTGELEYAFHSMYLYSDNANDYYGAYKLYRNDDKYVLKYQIFNPKYLGNYSDEFKRAYCYKSYVEDDFTIFNILRTDISSSYINLSSLEAYTENEYVDTTQSFDNISIVDIIFHLAANISVYNSQELFVEYNSEENSLFTLCDDKNTIANKKYLYYTFNVDINDYIELLNNDIVTLFYNMYKYYNEEYFFVDKHTLVTRILCKLYENIANVELNNINGDYGVMYIPLDLEFTYATSSANELNIYYSNNLFVTSLDLSSEYSNVDLMEFFNTNNTIVYDTLDVKQVKSYVFQIKYNDKYDNLINFIDIFNLYTLPYITSNNTWSVNGEDTGISAIGEDAGNPNIIILYSRGESVTILSAFSKINEVDITYSKRTFYVNPNMFHKYNTETNIECYAYIPDITNSNIEVFNNSIIISLSSVSNLTDTELQSDYIGNYVMSLWKIDNEEYKFNYIVDPISEDNYEFALTLDNMSSVFANSMNNDIISGSIIKLNAKVYKLAQEADTGSEYNWITIRAKNSEEYNEELGLKSNDSMSKYQNDLNVILQINRNISTVGNIIKTNSNDEKYISFENNDHINTSNITNLLYPKYITTTDIVTTEQDVVIPGQDALDIYYVDTDLYGDVVMSYEQLSNAYSAVSEQHTTETITREVKTSALSTTEFYDEFVFNSDVPTVDLREVILRNINVNNRVNILSLDVDGHMYNAYLGTSWDSSDKSELHIGTSKSNINIGNSTLINDDDKYNNFDKHNSISIDFDTIKLNSKSVESPTQLILKRINNKNYYYSSVKPIGNLSKYDMYAYTWDYMVKRYENNDEEFGSVLSKINDNFYGINNIDINPLTKLYICGVSQEHPEYQLINAVNDRNDESIIFRRLNIFTDTTSEFLDIIGDKVNDNIYTYNIDGQTEYYAPTRIGSISDIRKLKIGETINISNNIINIYPIVGRQCVEKENGKLYVKRCGISVVTDGILKYIVYAVNDVDEITGSYVYGYNTIDIYNLMKYYYNIDLSLYSSVNINAHNNTLISYTKNSNKYWYLIINDDEFENVMFDTNTRFDYNNINILNDTLDIIFNFEESKINIDIKFNKTNRKESLKYYISTYDKDSIYDKQSTN